MFELRSMTDQGITRWAVVLVDQHGTRRASAYWATREQGERSLERWRALEAAEEGMDDRITAVIKRQRKDPMAMLLDAIMQEDE